MGILDGRLLFSDAQAFTATDTHASAYIIENPIGKDVWGTAKNQDPGEGGVLLLHVAIATAFTATSPLTSILDIALQDSVSETSGSFNDLIILENDIKSASLVLGKDWVIGIPADCNNYLRMLYTVATQTFTAGAIDAWISIDPSVVKAKY